MLLGFVAADKNPTWIPLKSKSVDQEVVVPSSNISLPILIKFWPLVRVPTNVSVPLEVTTPFALRGSLKVPVHSISVLLFKNNKFVLTSYPGFQALIAPSLTSYWLNPLFPTGHVVVAEFKFQDPERGLGWADNSSW